MLRDYASTRQAPKRVKDVISKEGKISDVMAAESKAQTNLPTNLSVIPNQEQVTGFERKYTGKVRPISGQITLSTQPNNGLSQEDNSIFRRLFTKTYNPASEKDRELLQIMRSSANSLGGYDNFQDLRTLALAQRYGGDSIHGRIAQKRGLI